MNLIVSWRFQNTLNPNENISLSYPVDLRTVIPKWFTISFTAASGKHMERHSLGSWDFSSNLVMKDTSSRNLQRTKIATGVSASVVSLIVIIFAAFWLKTVRRRKNRTREKVEEVTTLTSSINEDLERVAEPRRFAYKDLISVTNNFSRDCKLGEGGFGPVYKGHQLELDVPIAVKKFSRGSKQGKREFIAEVLGISRLRHQNLVQLIGWCLNDNEFLLVYEYMPNGGIDSHLFGKQAHLSRPWHCSISSKSGSNVSSTATSRAAPSC